MTANGTIQTWMDLPDGTEDEDEDDVWEEAFAQASVPGTRVRITEGQYRGLEGTVTGYGAAALHVDLGYAGPSIGFDLSEVLVIGVAT